MPTFGLDAFRAALEVYATKSLLALSGAPDVAALLREVNASLRSLGLERIEDLQINADKGKAVVLCRHPRWGTCVYKSVSTQGPPGGVRTHVDSVQLTSASSTGLFPRAWAIGPNYTVEEFIDGSTLFKLPGGDWTRFNPAPFVEQLRAFRAPHHEESVLSTDETTLIVCRYAKKIAKAARYTVHGVGLMPVLRCARSARRRALLDIALRHAALVSLPRSYVLDDLATSNIVLARADDRLVIVDVESQIEGFFGFDYLWLVVMLTRTQCPITTIERMFDELCSDDFCRADGAGMLMRALGALMLDVLAVFIGSGPVTHRIAQLRDRALAGLAPQPELARG